MALQFHPKAEQNFNEQASHIRSQIVAQLDLKLEKDFGTEPYVDWVLPAQNMVSPSEIRACDATGRETARYRYSGSNVVGIEGEAFLDLRRLAEKMQRTPGLRSTVSIESVFDFLFDWVCTASAGNEAIQSASEFVLRRCDESVKQNTILIPIFGLILEKDLPVGGVLLRTVSRAEIDGWLLPLSEEVSPNHLEIASRKWRKELQGNTVAEMTLYAEPQRAYEVARLATDDAVAMLRLFSSAVFEPGMQSFCTPVGTEKVEQVIYCRFEEGHFRGASKRLANLTDTSWRISAEDADLMLSKGLRLLDALLKEESKSEFQEKLLDALLLYSRATLESRLSEKLLYIVVAIESILLKNENEPIQSNIAERIAFSIGKTPDERKKIVQNVKATYALRSKFVHHGHGIDDLTTVRQFMHYAWLFFMSLVTIQNTIKKTDELISLLEDRKFA